MSNNLKSVVWGSATVAVAFAFMLCFLGNMPGLVLLGLAVAFVVCYWRTVVWSSAAERELQCTLADQSHRGFDAARDREVESTLDREAHQRGWIRP